MYAKLHPKIAFYRVNPIKVVLFNCLYPSISFNFSHSPVFIQENKGTRSLIPSRTTNVFTFPNGNTTNI